MITTLRPLFDAFTQAFTTPTANPVVTIFVLSIVLVALTMLVLVMLLLLTPSQRENVTIRRYRRIRRDTSDADDLLNPEDGRDVVVASEVTSVEAPVSSGAAVEDDEAAEDVVPESAVALERPSAKSMSRAATTVLVCVLVAASIASAYVITGTDAYCIEQCHGGSESVKHASEVDHASCVACHEEPGVSGVVPNVVSRVRMTSRAVLSQGRPSGGANVSSIACLECHTDILDKTVSRARGIAMSHKEPVAAGVSCTECHAQTGHTKRRDYTMSSCITCHGASDALNECSLCHLVDPYDASARNGSVESSETIGSGRMIYPVVQVSDTNCGGCHDQVASCDPCHGTRMPHTKEFIARGHAPVAAFERKKMCEKCHEPLWCARGCHLSFEDGHGPTWRTTHMRSGPNSICVCHASRSGRTTPMCLLCHPK